MGAHAARQPGDGANGQDTSALLAAARLLVEKKDFDGAIASAKLALAGENCLPDDRVEAASILAAAGAKAEAVAAYIEAGTHFLYDLGDMQKARTAYASAHQVDPGNLDVIFQMGQADVVEGRTQDALAKFIDVLRKSNLKHVPALFEAGCIYQANGQYDQAILAFKKVLDRDKNHVQAIVHMGQLHQTKGMVPESLAYYLQAADIARESKQYGTAQQLLNMVLALDGGNQKARIMMDDLADRNRDDEELAAAAVVEKPKIAEAAVPAQTASVGSKPAVSAGQAVSGEIAQSVEEAKRLLETLLAERDEVQKELDDLSTSRLDVEIALARSKDEAEAAVAARDAAAVMRADAEKQVAALADSLTRTKAQSEEAARRKAELEAEAVTANAALHAAKKAESEVAASAEKRRAELESALAGLAAKQSEAQQAAAAAEAATKAAEKRKAELESEMAALAAKRVEAERAADGAAQAAAASAQAAASSAQAAASSASERAKIEGELAALRDQCKALATAKTADEAVATKAASAAKELQTQLDALAARHAEVKSEAEAAADHRDKIRAEIAAAEANLASLQQRVKSTAATAADADKLKKVSTQAKELEAAAQAAAAKLAETKSTVDALEARKHEVEEAYARAKSLAAAADEKRAESARAAEQAEALRSKREADAEALAARIAVLEGSLKDAETRAKLVDGENAALHEISAKVSAQRKSVLELEERKNELDASRQQAEKTLAQVQDEIASAQRNLEELRATPAPAGEPRRRATDESYAEAVVAAVPPQACSEALRSIESLAADGEIPFEIAAELAGLIHEGRAVEARRVARARANLEASPGPYLLVSADLARDLGDVEGAREAYRTLGAADPAKMGVVHQRMGQLFLTFADQGTAAALARDDAHYAATQDPAKALFAYADLVARFPNDPTFRQELGELHARLGNTSAAGLAYTQAMGQYLGSDEIAKAVELVPSLLAVRPDSGDALELAARAFERAGRAHDAQLKLDAALQAYHRSKSASDVERVCRHLAEIADDPVPYRRELAALLQEVGDAAGAAEQLVEAAERLLKWSNAGDALSLLREAAALSGDNESLRERIAETKARAADAQKSVDQATRAAMFLSKKQFDKAVEAYRAAVDKNPYNADACYQLACLLTDHFPDYPTAEQLLENAAELRPGHTATRYRLAIVKAARGQVEEAVELLVALARFDENNADFIDQFVERLEKDADGGQVAAKYRLGIAYRELGRVEEALVILQSIQREAEFMVLCLNAIGLCLRRQGLDTAAAKRFQKAIETPGYPENQYNEALYNLGDLYEAKHDPESLALSLSSYEELYARDCTYRDIADRIKAVKMQLGAAEGPKVKRLPNRSEAANDR